MLIKKLLIVCSLAVSGFAYAAASSSHDETSRMLEEYFGIDVSKQEKPENRWPNKVTPESIFFNEHRVTVPGEKRYYAIKINTLSSGFKEAAIVTGPEQALTDIVAKHLPRYFDEHSLETAIVKVLERDNTLVEKAKLVSLTVGQLYRLCDILLPAELLYLIQDLPGCTHQGTSCSKRLTLIQEHIKSRGATAPVTHEAKILVPTRKSTPNF